MNKDELKKENEKKKEYLRSYMPTVNACIRIDQDIETMRQAKMHPSMAYDDMPHGNEQHDLSDYICSLDELISKLLRARYKRVKLYTAIYTQIELMNNETEREVLKLHYLRGLKWEDVCCELKYSWRQIHRLHSDALTHFKMA